jgi:hypothetical protein
MNIFLPAEPLRSEAAIRTDWLSLNLSCVFHSYFLETVNFSPVLLNTELGFQGSYNDRHSVKRLNRVRCYSIKARKGSPKLGANESHHS